MRIVSTKPLSALFAALIFFLSLPVLAQTSSEQAEQIRKPARPLSAERSDILFRDERQTTERPNLVMDTMQLEDGDLVADIGSGPGYYSLPLAERVGPHGFVLAVDIQQGMLDQLAERMKEAGVANVYPLLGALDDPHLPPGKIDWILLVDAYHEFGDPQAMLARMRESLAPGGRVALVEYRGEDDWPDLPERVFRIPRDHRMTNDEVMSEWIPGGFELVKRHDFLPAQHLFIFKTAD